MLLALSQIYVNQILLQQGYLHLKQKVFVLTSAFKKVKHLYLQYTLCSKDNLFILKKIYLILT